MLTVEKDLIVVKFGSETVTNGHGMDQGRLDNYARQLDKLPNDLIVVSSGAVRAGQALAPDILDDQISAGIGSAEVVAAWARAFRRFNRMVAQVLVTDHELSDEVEGDIFFNSLRKCIRTNVVPIVNTNDLLSNEELPKRRWKGENDRPASHIAQVMGAEILLLLTEKNGLFDDSGNTIREVPYDLKVHENILDMTKARNKANKVDTMQAIFAKTLASIEAAGNGVQVYMAGADQDFEAILAGKTGTHFAAAA